MLAPMAAVTAGGAGAFLRPLFQFIKPSHPLRQHRRLPFSSAAAHTSSTTAAAIQDDAKDGLGLAASGSGAMIDVNPLRGMMDFVPEDMRLRKWLFLHFQEVSRILAFEEVDFPVLESKVLFVRKAGEEITKQLYNFEDKGGRHVVLRPEITPLLARLVIKQGISISLPSKLFTIGQCWL